MSDNTEKLKAVLIIGYDLKAYLENLKEFAQLYKRPGFLVLGDGIKKLDQSEFDILTGRIDQSTRIDIYVHGKTFNDRHYIGVFQQVQETAMLFDMLQQAAMGNPLQVHFWSCRGGKTIDYVNFLGKGSLLFNYVPKEDIILGPLTMQSLKSNILRLQNDVDSAASPIERFIANLPMNMLQAASIATYINEQPHVLLLEPKLYEVVGNTDDILAKEVEEISQFACGMQNLLAGDNVSAYSHFEIRGLLNSTFPLKDKEEFKAKYFFHTVLNNNTHEVELVSKSYSAEYFSILVNQELNGYTMLYLAVMHYITSAIIGILIDYSSDIDKANFKGYTPLMAAALNNNLKVVKILVENHADLNRVNNEGNTPIEIAIKNGHREIVEFLTSAMQASDLVVDVKQELAYEQPFELVREISYQDHQS